MLADDTFGFTYDAETDAAYLRVGTERPVERTIACFDDLNVDLDDKNRVVGVEFLTASERLHWSVIAASTNAKPQAAEG